MKRSQSILTPPQATEPRIMIQQRTNPLSSFYQINRGRYLDTFGSPGEVSRNTTETEQFEELSPTALRQRFDEDAASFLKFNNPDYDLGNTTVKPRVPDQTIGGYFKARSNPPFGNGESLDQMVEVLTRPSDKYPPRERLTDFFLSSESGRGNANQTIDKVLQYCRDIQRNSDAARSGRGGSEEIPKRLFEGVGITDTTDISTAPASPPHSTPKNSVSIRDVSFLYSLSERNRSSDNSNRKHSKASTPIPNLRASILNFEEAPKPTQTTTEDEGSNSNSSVSSSTTTTGSSAGPESQFQFQIYKSQQSSSSVANVPQSQCRCHNHLPIVIQIQQACNCRNNISRRSNISDSQIVRPEQEHHEPTPREDAALPQPKVARQVVSLTAVPRLTTQTPVTVALHLPACNHQVQRHQANCQCNCASYN